jgi:hypothetical protein
MGRKSCKVCSLDPAARNAIEAEIQKKTRYRDIEQMCGVSRSVLNKHALQCLAVRAMAATKKISFKNRRLICHRLATDSDPESWDVFGGDEITRDQLQQTDIVITIVYEPIAVPKNPLFLDALASTQYRVDNACIEITRSRQIRVETDEL